MQLWEMESAKCVMSLIITPLKHFRHPFYSLIIMLCYLPLNRHAIHFLTYKKPSYISKAFNLQGDRKAQAKFNNNNKIIFNKN